MDPLATVPLMFTGLSGHVMAGLLGLIVGSFVNVVIARLPERRSLVRPGSACPACRAPIRWRDNVPVVGYLLLRGRCRSCGAAISARYPVVELLCALLFVAAETRFGWSWVLAARDLPWLAGLLAIAFIDAEHRIIPDRLNFSFLALGLATAYWAPIGLGLAVAGAVVGFGFFYLFAWLYHRMTGRSGLGGGDIKFLAMTGAFLGPLGVFTTVLVSSVAGSVLGLLWLWLRGRTRRGGRVMKTAIPYGPFLVIGALYYYLVGDLLWLPFTTPT